MPLIGRAWRFPQILLGLFILEFANTVTSLALFGIAAPDLYRTLLWGDGFQNGFNSSPAQILYAYANYKPIPKTPLVWSHFLTNYNVVISVFSMFILLIKVVMNVMNLFHPLLSLFIHAILCGIWAVSAYGQAGPDRSDPQHPSSVAWYVSKSCDVTFNKSNVHYCQLAKGAFAVTCFMLAIYFLHLPLAIYSLIPTAEAKARHARKSSIESHDKRSPDSELTMDQRWEQEEAPKTPVSPGDTPITPRTRAFNTLSGALPLRSMAK
ncbi:MAG: hypothetical protein M1813_006945 [Trichoglossum hirsutum]|nr:MAG: hypothetical protein M1813_006945 [Trichoglossum hirsutum]